MQTLANTLVAQLAIAPSLVTDIEALYENMKAVDGLLSTDDQAMIEQTITNIVNPPPVRKLPVRAKAQRASTVAQAALVANHSIVLP